MTVKDEENVINGSLFWLCDLNKLTPELPWFFLQGKDLLTNEYPGAILGRHTLPFP